MQRFLRRKDVEQITGLPTSTLYDQMHRGGFPRPIKITANRVAWLESDIIEWQQARIAAARGEAA